MVSFSGWLVFDLIGILFLLLAGLYIYFKYVLYNFWSSKGVAHRKPIVPIGTLWPVVAGKTSIGEFFGAEYFKFKDHRFFGEYTFHKPSLVISDPELIRYVMTKEFSHFQDRGIYCNETVDPLSAHLFSISGTKWKNLRVKLTPTFTSGKIKQMFDVVKECGDELAVYLKGRAEAGELLEMKDIFARFATDVIASTAFGLKCNSIHEPDHEFRECGRKVFEPQKLTNAAAFFAPKLMYFFGIRFFNKEATSFFAKVFKDNVLYREANGVIRYDFMNLVMQLMKKGRLDDDEGSATPHISETVDGKISMPEATAQAFVFFLAGFDTSSSTLTFCLYELAVNEDIQNKAHSEIDRGLKKYGGLTYESLNEMPYLHKIVSETLRKYPVVPILNRVCTEAIDLPTTNLHVPKGLDVVIPVMGLHYDPEIYPNPEIFDPERFNEENKASRHPYAYLPFGEGSRMCIGMRFGLVQIKIGLISSLSRYRFKLGPNTPVPLKFDVGNIGLLADCGVHLRVESRNAH